MTSSEDRAATHPFALLARHRLVPVVEIPDVAAEAAQSRGLDAMSAREPGEPKLERDTLAAVLDEIAACTRILGAAKG